MLMQELVKHLPSGWSTNAGYTSNYETIEIPSSDARYRAISSKVSGSFNAGVVRIESVENPYLYGQFLLKKAEYETRGATKVVQLFHDTGSAKVHSILSTNLDRRLANRVKFGRGVSFSPSPEYANKQSARSNGADRAMIIADVLVGKTYATSGSDALPRANCDTAVGNRGNVYVKFDDNEFYPKYVVYYTSKQRGLSSWRNYDFDSHVDESYDDDIYLDESYYCNGYDDYDDYY